MCDLVSICHISERFRWKQGPTIGQLYPNWVLNCLCRKAALNHLNHRLGKGELFSSLITLISV